MAHGSIHGATVVSNSGKFYLKVDYDYKAGRAVERQSTYIEVGLHEHAKLLADLLNLNKAPKPEPLSGIERAAIEGYRFP